jgi:exodeoxyribonuclease VII small subunit
MSKAEGKRAAGAAKGKDERSFEEVLRRLEEIVDHLESGELPLETSLALFEEGVGLAKDGHHRLEAAERRITELTADGREQPLAPEAGGESGTTGDDAEEEDDDDDATGADKG